MLSSPSAPSPFPTFGRFPLYVTFRELYCYSPSIPIPLGSGEGAFENAFLPVGCRWHETEVSLVISSSAKADKFNRQGLNFLEKTRRSKPIILCRGKSTSKLALLKALPASRSQVHMVLLMSSLQE
jgi:hypothetical protein